MTAVPPDAPPPAGPAYAVSTCYRHPDRPAGVRCTRCDRPICPDCMIPAAVGFQCPECVREGNRTVRQPRTVYGGSIARGGLDVTRVLIAINVVVYLITAITGHSLLNPNPNTVVYRDFALVPAAVGHGHWWLLISAMFLHYNVFHIAFNMWALYVIGTPLERMLGRWRYLVLYFLAGIGGSLLSVAFGPVLESAAGASGAIFGLFGAFYILLRSRGLQTGGIVGVIALNLVFSFTFPDIDWRGHVGGLVVGAVVAGVIAWAPAGPRRTQVQVAGCAAIAVVLAAVGFLAAHKAADQCPIFKITRHGRVECLIPVNQE